MIRMATLPLVVIGILDCLPREILIEIFKAAFPYIGKDADDTLGAMVMRVTSKLTREIMDTEIIQYVTMLQTFNVIARLSASQLLLFKGVKELGLYGSRPEKHDNSMLSQMTWLEKLSLMSCPHITYEGMLPLTKLLSLNLTEPTTRQCYSVSFFTQLEELSFMDNSNCTDRNLMDLTRLRSLSLDDDSGISGSFLSCKPRERFPYLTSLSLCGYSQFGHDSITRLAPQIIFLRLTDNDVFPLPIIDLMSNLKELILERNTTFGDDQLKHLTRLQKLTLNDVTKVTDKGISTLTQLEFLELCNEYSRISSTGVSCLSGSLKSISIKDVHTLFMRDLVQLKNLEKVYYVQPEYLTPMGYQYRHNGTDLNEIDRDALEVLQKRGVKVESYLITL